MIRALLIALLCLPILAGAKNYRDPVEKQAFRADHPCPITGKTSGACPGYEVDHRIALCAGGADKPENMQWLSVDDHKRKTKKDIKHCKWLRQEGYLK